MQLVFKTLLTSMLFIATALPAYAADRCGLRDDLRSIERRIDRGLDSGKLTRREVRWLRQEKREIRELYRDLKSDGRTSRRDCRIIARNVRKLKNRVRRLKHNDIRSYDSYYERDRDYGRRPQKIRRY